MKATLYRQLLALVTLQIVVAEPQAQTVFIRDRFDGFHQFVSDTLAEWKVPGLAVAIVDDTGPMFSKGFGIAAKNVPVDEDTIFYIASCTKSFTAYLVGKLVDDGLLSWEKPVQDYLPDFVLQDQYASTKTTVRDLLSHRTGLPRHDLSYGFLGDDPCQFIHRLRHLPAAADFRTEFQYNNMMYMATACLLENVTGRTYGKLLSQHIFEPLGMTSSFVGRKDAQETGRMSENFIPRDGYYGSQDPIKAPSMDVTTYTGAGAIASSLKDVTKWATLMLNVARRQEAMQGQISLESFSKIVSPIIITRDPQPEISFSATTYAHGWFIDSFNGHRMISHGGFISGFNSMVALLPEDNLAIVILNNHSPGGFSNDIIVRHAISTAIGDNSIDWRARGRKIFNASRDAYMNSTSGLPPRIDGTYPSHSMSDYIGVFYNPGYDSIRVKSISDKGMLLDLQRQNISGYFSHYHYDIFDGELYYSPALLYSQAHLQFRTGPDGNISEIGLASDAVLGVTEPLWFDKIS